MNGVTSPPQNPDKPSLTTRPVRGEEQGVPRPCSSPPTTASQPDSARRRWSKGADMTNDVEKRWRDPAAARAATIYVTAIVAVAGAAGTGFLLFLRDTPQWSWGVPLVLFAGGLGAFGQTYRVWRAGGTWPIWHGAGWSLLTLMLVSLALPAAAITH